MGTGGRHRTADPPPCAPGVGDGRRLPSSQMLGSRGLGGGSLWCDLGQAPAPSQMEVLSPKACDSRIPPSPTILSSRIIKGTVHRELFISEIGPLTTTTGWGGQVHCPDLESWSQGLDPLCRRRAG